jgi:chemotaxis protein histidine kinase CheA
MCGLLAYRWQHQERMDQIKLEKQRLEEEARKTQAQELEAGKRARHEEKLKERGAAICEEKREEERKAREAKVQEEQALLEKRFEAEQKAQEEQRTRECREREAKKNEEQRSREAAEQKELQKEEERHLSKPATVMREHVEKQMQLLDADPEILKEMEVNGMSCYMAAESWVCGENELQERCLEALRDVPPEVVQSVAKSASMRSDTNIFRKRFEFGEGNATTGHYFQLYLMKQSWPLTKKVSVAVMIWGMTFECNKVVEYFREVCSEIPIFDESTETDRVLTSTHVHGFCGKRVDEMWEAVPRTTKKFTGKYQMQREQIPIFKSNALDADKVNSIFKAMEYQACERALLTINSS